MFCFPLIIRDVSDCFYQPGKRPKDVIVDYLTNLFEHARAQIKAETSLVDDISETSLSASLMSAETSRRL